MLDSDFTNGPILGKMVRFAFPVMVALFLQSLYGAVDLLVVGRFASTAELSGVSTGSLFLQMITMAITSLSMGITILVARMIGAGRTEECGRIIGAGVIFFVLFGIVFSILMQVLSPASARLMNAPPEAFDATVKYLRICTGGFLAIIGYNVFGAVFRGLGNSRLPLYCVAIAAFLNVILDLLFVAVFHQGAAGAAIATVIAQALSVLFSLLLSRSVMKGIHVSFEGMWDYMRKILSLGLPLCFSDLLVGFSFVVIIGIGNSLGLVASAGIGVAEKVCGFIMLVPSAFSQSLSAISAQNFGAGKSERARTTLIYGIGLSLVCGLVLFYLSFFHGDLLCRIFVSSPEVVASASDYLKAYAIDCVQASFLFCFIGYFNGRGCTRFVMIQGLVGAFCIRIPLAYVFARLTPVSLFHVGLATPAASSVQILAFLVYAWALHRKGDEKNMKIV